MYYEQKILPVEVKAGKTGTLKSLRLFLYEKKALLGVRFSLQPLSFTDSVLSIPLYAVEAMPGLLDQIVLQGKTVTQSGVQKRNPTETIHLDSSKSISSSIV
jgi:hypothetical protein